MFPFVLLTFLISARVARRGREIETLFGGSIEIINAQFRKL
jgi:hypothetical protein